MNSHAQQPRICVVCGAKSESLQFGVEACRACAAFFRRAVQLQRKYLCRQSTGKCDISKDVRFCRRCRFNKCLDAGMSPACVPPLNQPIPSDSTHTCLLDVIADQYKKLENQGMRSDEYVVATAYGDRLKRRNGLVPGKIGLLCLCIRASLQSMIGFMSSSFPDICDFDDNERWSLIKNFMTSRFIFDGVYRAQKYFPGDDNIFMVSFLTFVEIDNFDFYISDLESIYDKAHSLSMMRETTKCTCDCLGPLLKRAEIDEVETMAIYGLLCWPSCEFRIDGDLANSSSRVMQTCYKYHLRIFKELHNHYLKMGLTDYSSRISQITAILLCVQAAIHRLKEDMEIYRLLDVFIGNELLYNVVK